MKIIGLIGGVACGKTTIANHLREMGASVISADPIVHEVLKVREIVDQMRMRARVNKKWGLISDDVSFRETRRKVAEIVFNDPAELRFLEDVTGPLVIKRILDSISLYHPKYTSAIILDVPLLLEMDMRKYCDLVWYIDMPKDKRLQNFKSRYGADWRIDSAALERDFNARESRQLSREQKIEASDAVVENCYGDIEKTKAKLTTLWAEAIK